MLRIYHSNRVEILVDRLIEVTADPLATPMEAEIVVTQSQGMAHWLFMQWAQKKGIAANIRLVLPASFIWLIIGQNLHDIPDATGFDIDALAWKILEVLSQALNKAEFAPLRQYLSADDSELKRYHLCRRIADVFDQYLIYRPHLLIQWEQETRGDWQSELWRTLCSRQRSPLHRARLLDNFQQLSSAGHINRQALPRRVSVFGINAMPPAHLDVFHRISRITDVHLFLLNPCMFYWGDIKDAKTQGKIRNAKRKSKISEGDDYYTVGNPLLASWGKQGQEFMDLIQQFGPYLEEELFEANPGDNLLQRIQADILFLKDVAEEEVTGNLKDSASKIRIDDRSILIQSCHSRMREIQVLHDQLLTLFDEDFTLTPRDVAVMAPDIEQYAPYIEAVFGASVAHSDTLQLSRKILRPSLPCSIADRVRATESPIFNAFLQLLDLPNSRFAAAQVLSVLATPAVQRRFDLDPGELDRIRTWVRECGIRWGIDGKQRAAMGLPDTTDNSWSAGFERLFLGYAMTPSVDPFHGIIAYDQIEGEHGETLGKFYQYFRTLCNFKERLDSRLPATEWSTLIDAVINAFFEVDDNERTALLTIQQAKDDLVGQHFRAGFQNEIGIAIVREFFKHRFGESSTSQRFVSGQVTFCQMLSMRSIPFKVVCLLGLNEGEFPRRTGDPGFNLLNQSPQPGDRSRRDDDRYLFLEALLSARQHFYISFIGNSILDNRRHSPSILVSELLDYIEARFAFTNDKANAFGEKIGVSDHLLTSHPLQPFDQRYFKPGAIMASYGDEWLACASSANARMEPRRAFLDAPLDNPDEEMRVVDVKQLIRFFANPAEFFLRQRLFIHIPGVEECLEDAEPFTLDALQKYHLRERLLEKTLNEESLDGLYQLLKASGSLPHGAFGDFVFQSVAGDAEASARAIKPFVTDRIGPIPIAIELQEFTLTGRLENLTKGGQTRYRAANIRAKDRLSLWIYHLVLNVLKPKQCALHSIYLGKDGSLELGTEAKARTHLEALLTLYWSGLSKQLSFFPKSSYAFAVAVNDGKEPWPAVRKAWQGNTFKNIPGDADDPYVRIAFEGKNPFDDSFMELATTVFRPLLMAQARFQTVAGGFR